MIRWTAEMNQMLADLYPDMNTKDLAEIMGLPTSRVYEQAMRRGIRKSKEYFEGVTTRFQPGNKSWNTGRKGWQQCGRSAETQFSTGIKPPNTQPLGSLRLVTVRGSTQLERKVNELPGPNHVRWKAVHRLVWEAVNGQTPEGCIVIFKPGMKTLIEAEITIDKVECITRAENARRNHIKNKHPELTGLYQLKSQITRQINRLSNDTHC